MYRDLICAAAAATFIATPVLAQTTRTFDAPFPHESAKAIRAASPWVGIEAAPVSGQPTLAFDINGFGYAFKDAGGTAAFGGETHTGTVDWSFLLAPPTMITDVRVGDEGPFGTLTEVPLGALLSDFVGTVEFVSGRVMGGEFTVTLDTGDTYTTQLRAGRGQINELTTGGFTLDGLTIEGEFSDDMFGDVDVSEFVAVQGDPVQLPGSLLKFRFNPGPSAAGSGDLEVFVTVVPLPPAAMAGAGTLLGAIGISVILRRRRH